MADTQVPARTPEGKWVIYEVSTGARVERWPVDARDYLKSGDYVAEPPENAERAKVEHVPAEQAPTEPAAEAPPAPAPDPVPHVTNANAQLGAESPAGVPLVVSDASTASPARPVDLSGGKKGRK